ncbi:MAG: PEP/pyruvate-binding domain-containing protein [Bdellovibrionales bacterium]
MNELYFIKWFENISKKDIPEVGGKSASLGEMFQALAPKGIQVPPGFAVTAHASARSTQVARTLVRSEGMRDRIKNGIRKAYRQLCEPS